MKAKLTPLVMFLLSLIMLSLSACSTVSQRQMSAISSGVHATKKSMEAGRFDLAEKYNNEVSRMVPPPKKAIKIESFKTDAKKATKTEKAVESKSFVVLPQKFVDKPVVVAESTEYKQLLEENKVLAKKEKAAMASVEKFEKQADKVLRDKEAELMKEKKRSWWGWVISFGSIGSIIALVVLCIFFPPLVPIIFNIFGTLISSINGLLSRLIKRNPS